MAIEWNFCVGFSRGLPWKFQVGMARKAKSSFYYALVTLKSETNQFGWELRVTGKLNLASN